MTPNKTVEAGSLVMGVSTSLMAFITDNATAITVLCTFSFGLVYASCAIWNAWTNHKTQKDNKRGVVEALIDDLQDSGLDPSVVDVVVQHLRNG